MNNNNNKNKISLYERITRLETRQADIAKNIKAIKDNHIKDIYDKLDKQKSWLIALLTAVILTLISVLFSIFQTKIGL